MVSTTGVYMYKRWLLSLSSKRRLSGKSLIYGTIAACQTETFSSSIELRLVNKLLLETLVGLGLSNILFTKGERSGGTYTDLNSLARVGNALLHWDSIVSSSCLTCVKDGRLLAIGSQHRSIKLLSAACFTSDNLGRSPP